jgi:hypothetical protein
VGVGDISQLRAGYNSLVSGEDMPFHSSNDVTQRLTQDPAELSDQEIIDLLPVDAAIDDWRCSSTECGISATDYSIDRTF